VFFSSTPELSLPIYSYFVLCYASLYFLQTFLFSSNYLLVFFKFFHSLLNLIFIRMPPIVSHVFLNVSQLSIFLYMPVLSYVSFITSLSIYLCNILFRISCFVLRVSKVEKLWSPTNPGV
jgi:hypothetical protein